MTFVARNDRARRMSVLIREGAERHLPALLAVGIISEQPIFRKERVHHLAIGNGRDCGGVIQRVRRLDTGTIHGTLPQQFTGLAIKALCESLPFS